MAFPTEERQRQLHRPDNRDKDQSSLGSESRIKQSIAEKTSQRPRSGNIGKVPQLLINVGFIAALILSCSCLIFSAAYLFKFLGSTNEGINSTIQNVGTNTTPGAVEVAVNGRLVMGRIALLSCGILVGISFGFLGFALFLLGIKESIDVDIDADTYKAKFARMSPGVLIILCSTVLTGVCATRQTPFWYENSLGPSDYSETDLKSPDNNESKDDSGRNADANNRDLPPQPRKLKRP